MYVMLGEATKGWRKAHKTNVKSYHDLGLIVKHQQSYILYSNFYVTLAATVTFVANG